MRHLFRLAAALLAAFVLSLPALAADRAIIILDASGSMWAQIDGKSRIEIARDTLSQVLEGVDDNLELGFMAYGHRTKGDCDDIEMIVAPAAGTASSIASAAMSLNPKGKTPLSASVRMAADTLAYEENKATVVLITDGIETCNADPCALASELEAAGVDFTVNVVGFGLTKEEGAQVQCLAENTGGKYLSADDEGGLKDAIDVAVNDTTPPPPPPVEEPEPEITYNFVPTAYLSEGDDKLISDAIVWEFAKPNKSDGSPGDWVRTEYGTKFKGDLEPGDYVVWAKLDYAQVAIPVTIEAGKVTETDFVLNAGHLTLRPIPSEGAEPDRNAAVYTEFANGLSTTSYGEVKLYVPAGTTKVEVTIGAAKLTDEVAIAAGERVVKDIVVGVGHATVNSFYIADMKVDDGNSFTEILGAKKDIQGDRKSYGYAYGPDTKFDLLPGDYVASVTFDGVKTEQPFTIVAGEAVEVSVTLNAGVLFIDAPGADLIEVFSAKKDIQGDRTAFGYTYDVTANRTLPVGDYFVQVTMKDGTKKEANASVAAGERTEIKVE